jgi:hypothetical protein
MEVLLTSITNKISENLNVETSKKKRKLEEAGEGSKTRRRAGA